MDALVDATARRLADRRLVTTSHLAEVLYTLAGLGFWPDSDAGDAVLRELMARLPAASASQLFKAGWAVAKLELEGGTFLRELCAAMEVRTSRFSAVSVVPVSRSLLPVQPCACQLVKTWVMRWLKLELEGGTCFVRELCAAMEVRTTVLSSCH